MFYLLVKISNTSEATEIEFATQDEALEAAIEELKRGYIVELIEE